MTAASDILRFMTAGRPDAAPEAETSDARETSDATVAADRRRVEQLYVRLEVKLTNVVYRWLWNREEARDVLQEAFVRLWRTRARIDWERVEPLVFRIALNLAANRRSRPSVPLQGADRHPSGGFARTSRPRAVIR